MAFHPVTIKKVTSAEVASATSTPNNSWNFAQSGDGAGGIYVDFTANMSPTGDFLKAIGFNVVLNSIRNCLLTPLGTYPFDPNYGSLLHQKIFMPADDKTEEEIRYEVIGRVVQFDDRIVVSNVDTQFFNNNKGFRINVTLQRYGLDHSITIDFPYELYTQTQAS